MRGEISRIFHRYELWECYKSGLYENNSGLSKEQCIQKVVELFSDSNNTKAFMQKVIDEWQFSCEHNLTNLALNRVAWLGQAACCLYAKIPYAITMESWSFVDKEYQEQANKIAESIISVYETKLLNV